jgi:hypothetical protein
MTNNSQSIFSIVVLSLFIGMGCGDDVDENDQDGDGVTVAVDCDDNDASVYPNADELCDGVDNDCDGDVDESAVDAPMWFIDADGDGYGQPAKAEGISSCDALDGYADNADDCDDSAVTTNPAADEYCDGIDTDCDDVEDNDPLDGDSYYPDVDGDGFGDDSAEMLSCTEVDGYVTQGGDCDDLDTEIHDGLEEICDDGIDQDCDGIIDDTCLNTVETSSAMTQISATGSTSFGSSLATGDFDGDGVTDIVVGASGDYTEAYFGGAAFMFSGADLVGPISSEAAISAHFSDTDYGYFGSSMTSIADLDEDGNDELLVSSYGMGTVSLITGSLASPTWTVGATFAGDVDLGRYIISAGDYTNDGETDVLLSGDGVDDAGAAYLFAGPFDGDYATTDARLTIAGAEPEGDLGFAGTLADVSGDGVDDLLVSSSAIGAGSVMVFLSDQSGVVTPEDADHTIYGIVEDDDFGDLLAVGDANGDGAIDLAVGAPGESTLAANAGAVYVFSDVMNDESASDAGLTVFATDSSDNLGHHAGAMLLEDVNADGRDDLMIGFYGDDSLYDNAGGAYLVFGERTGSWTIMETDVRMVGAAESVQVGKSLATGDLNDDGFLEIIVGSATSTPDQGAIWVFSGGDL